MVRAQIAQESALETDQLRALFLFETLPDQHLQLLADNGCLLDLESGLIIVEGEPAQYFYVLVDGEVALCKRSDDRDVETGRTSHVGAYFGATASFIETPPTTYGFSVRATGPTRVICLSGDFFGEFVKTQYPMAVHLLQGMHVDHEGVHQVIDQQRRIQALGTLTAGLMHGLNNPAGAITRIASQLRSHQLADRQFLPAGALSMAEATAYQRFRTEVAATVHAPRMAAPSALERTRREEGLDDWLTRQGVEQPWEMAPILAAAGVTETWLQRVVEAVSDDRSPGRFEMVVAALTERVDTLMLLDELASAAAEVSALVASAQRYSQMDSAPLAMCDINELLESTLAVMAGAFGAGIVVERDYADDLPPLLCFAGELNQAWTNIIANAVDALHALDADNGTITVRTDQPEPGVIRVDICDNGIGIDPAIHDRIFLPFFTTKPVGHGVGMGLDLAWRTVVGVHHGSLSVTSQPGATRFTACLPIQGTHPAER